jgi:alkaline phosphatase D
MLSLQRSLLQSLRPHHLREIFTDRRLFLRSGSLLCLAPFLTRATLAAENTNPSFSSNPFTLGVASGDPTSDGFVIWTRLALQPLEGGGMPNESFRVEWVVANDSELKSIVQKGTAMATPELGHSVHVEVEGLPADRWYFYGFRCGDAVSKIGRSRTMPARESLPESMRFAFTSCQSFEQGLYTGYQHMAQDELDLVVHLGDYIYEYAGKPESIRTHVGGETQTLDDYRNRHAQYRTDPFLQEMHARAPWLVVWDDHELDNNYANDISEESSVSSEMLLDRRANAYQAYYEMMPLRRKSLPSGPNMQLYRTIEFGRLASFQMLDTRQYRTDQPNGDGNRL